MEKTDLIQKAAQLINNASAANAAGLTDEADMRLEELRELLNLAHADTAAADEKKDDDTVPAIE